MRLSFAIILFAGLCVAGPAQAADAEAGKAAYAKKCRMCHGPEGQGNPAIAKSQGVEFRDLRSKEVQAKSDAELKKDALGGHGKKKPVKNVSPEELDDIIAHVRAMAKK